LEQDNLKPYLDRSAAHLGLAMGTGFSDATFWSRCGRQVPKPVLDDSVLPCFWQFSQDHEKKWDSMRFGNHLSNRIGANVKVVVNATVVQILTNSRADMVNGVEIAAPDGTRRTLRAKAVVLCAGGLENPRLLLTSNQIKPSGLGNDRDQVGRYLMDHLRGNLATFEIRGSEKLQKQFGYYRVLGHNFLHGMRLNPKIQRAEKLLNASAWIAGDLSVDDPWEAVKRVVRQSPRSTSDLLMIAKNTGWLAGGAKSYLLEKVGLPHKLDQLNLLCMCEQAPDPESRVTLTQATDRFGTPLMRVDWRVHDLERKSLCRMVEVVSQALDKVGLPRPTPEHWVRNG
jgi:choline dehydrogenase-like flavoprotein